MLVLRPGALGDTLLAVPALRALRRHFGRLTLAAHGEAARLLAALGEVEDGLAFDDPRIGPVLREGCDSEPVVAWLDPARAPGLKDALLVAPSRPADERHCAQYLVETLAPLGIPADVDARPLRVKPLASEDVLIHPGSGSRAKNWPAESFAALARHLPSASLIVGEADGAAAEAVDACLGTKLPRLEHLPLAQLARRLAGCRAFIGNDSGISHLAGLCGARTLVLFGPTSPTVWRPLGPRVSVHGFDVLPEALAVNLDL